MQAVVLGSPAGVWMVVVAVVGSYVWCGGVITLRLGWLKIVFFRERR